MKVLTVISLQISLERYRVANGSYPSTLDMLFPTYAPLGQDGQPLASAPRTTDGYTYAGGVTNYKLSVVLASGMPYLVEGPFQ